MRILRLIYGEIRDKRRVLDITMRDNNEVTRVILKIIVEVEEIVVVKTSLKTQIIIRDIG